MKSNSRQKLLEKIDQSRDKAVAFLRDMVVIPSVTGDEAQIQTFLSKYMTKIGLDVDMWETDWEELKKHPGYRPVDRGYEGGPNIVATWKGAGGGRSLLLTGQYSGPGARRPGPPGSPPLSHRSSIGGDRGEQGEAAGYRRRGTRAGP